MIIKKDKNGEKIFKCPNCKKVANYNAGTILVTCGCGYGMEEME